MESENLLFDKLSRLMMRSFVFKMHVKEIMLDVRERGWTDHQNFHLTCISHIR